MSAAVLLNDANTLTGTPDWQDRVAADVLFICCNPYALPQQAMLGVFGVV